MNYTLSGIINFVRMFSDRRPGEGNICTFVPEAGPVLTFLGIGIVRLVPDSDAKEFPLVREKSA